MNAHIINCDESLFLDRYRQNGYIGVGLVIRKTSAQALSNACRTTYSMYADMKTVFPGDLIFVHAGEYIYGVFEAKSLFKEEPNVPSIFLSPNIHYNPRPDNPNSGWQTLVNRPLPVVNNDYRQLSISHFVDSGGQNLCFEKGFLAKEVFDLKRKGKIWSIPERWKYPDSARTVRPLMPTEAKELIRLLERENGDTNNRLTITPKNVSNFSDIQLILNPRIVENEKVIEAWLCENLQTPTLHQIFGNITSFGNNVQIGYLQGIDIFGYTEGTTGICKYKVIEVKKGARNFPADIQQTLQYMDWVTEYLANGNSKFIDGYIVARSFDQRFIDFVRNHNTVSSGRQLSLIEFDYDPPAYNTLKFKQFSE